MLGAFLSGDPYLGTAIATGLAPKGATRATHAKERALMKPVVLGVLYGQEAWGIARRTGMSEVDAAELLRGMKKAYAKFFIWRENVTLSAVLAGFQTTRLGWRVHLPPGRIPNDRSLSNHPVQGTGADILRVASILAFERGVKLGALVHDSIVLVGPRQSVTESIEVCRAAMVEAGRKIIGVDLQVKLGGAVFDERPAQPELDCPVLWPGRYYDDGGFTTWQIIRELCPAGGAV